jgi:hypothetical protein
MQFIIGKGIEMRALLKNKALIYSLACILHKYRTKSLIDWVCLNRLNDTLIHKNELKTIFVEGRDILWTGMIITKAGQLQLNEQSKL